MNANENGAVQFWLATMETIGLEEPRRCDVLRVLARPEIGDKVVLVQMDRPVRFDDAAGIEHEARLAILAPRALVEPVVDPVRWPVRVHVLYPLIAIDPCSFAPSGEWVLDLAVWYHHAWAEMYPTLERAQQKR